VFTKKLFAGSERVARGAGRRVALRHARGEPRLREPELRAARQRR
jgi:hypothetical protein